MLRRVQNKLTDVSEVLTASIVLIMKAVSISEASVDFYQTIRRNIPENGHFHTRRRENPKSHQVTVKHH
jgi:hypothetical protein